MAPDGRRAVVCPLGTDRSVVKGGWPVEVWDLSGDAPKLSMKPLPWSADAPTSPFADPTGVVSGTLTAFAALDSQGGHRLQVVGGGPSLASTVHDDGRRVVHFDASRLRVFESSGEEEAPVRQWTATHQEPADAINRWLTPDCRALVTTNPVSRTRTGELFEPVRKRGRPGMPPSPYDKQPGR